MCAMQASDGTNHHSASRARLHDELSAKKGAASVTPMQGAGHPAPTKMPIEEHVGIHGPATKMEYEHDEAKGMHHVTSHHGEGEESKHHSVHKTHEAAHEHMGKAMGMGDEEQEESPDAGEEKEMAASAGGGGSSSSQGMPGLGG